jgi:hypothetical protein
MGLVDYTITNHDFLRGSSWLICHFLLLDMYILVKGQGFNNIFVTIDQFNYNSLFD